MTQKWNRSLFGTLLLVLMLAAGPLAGALPPGGTAPPGEVVIERAMGQAGQLTLTAAPAGWRCEDLDTRTPVSVGSVLDASKSASVACWPPPLECASVSAGGYYIRSGSGFFRITSSCGSLSVSKQFSMPFSNPAVAHASGSGPFPWVCSIDESGLGPDLSSVDYWAFCDVNLPRSASTTKWNPPGHVTIHRFPSPTGLLLLKSPPGWTCRNSNNVVVSAPPAVQLPTPHVACTPESTCRSVTATAASITEGPGAVVSGSLDVVSKCGGVTTARLTANVPTTVPASTVLRTWDTPAFWCSTDPYALSGKEKDLSYTVSCDLNSIHPDTAFTPQATLTFERAARVVGPVTLLAAPTGWTCTDRTNASHPLVVTGSILAQPSPSVTCAPPSSTTDPICTSVNAFGNAQGAAIYVQSFCDQGSLSHLADVQPGVTYPPGSPTTGVDVFPWHCAVDETTPDLETTSYQATCRVNI